MGFGEIPTRLEPIDLYWLNRRLDIATEEVRRLTPEMSVLELKAALSDIPGVETMTVGYAPSGNQLVTIEDRTIEVGPMASVDEIKLALLNPWIKTENTKMSISDDLKAARAKLQQARQNASSAVAESANVAGLVMEEIAKVEKETEEMRAEIAGMNGGPA
jgi:hypothetical protein